MTDRERGDRTKTLVALTAKLQRAVHERAVASSPMFSVEYWKHNAGPDWPEEPDDGSYMAFENCVHPDCRLVCATRASRAAQGETPPQKPGPSIEQIAKMIAWDEYGDLQDSWIENHSCGGYVGCCGGGKEIDREALQRVIVKAFRESAVPAEPPARAAAPQESEELLALRPDAHRHLSVVDSYKILAGLFADIQECHSILSRRGRVLGNRLSERVMLLCQRAEDGERDQKAMDLVRAALQVPAAPQESPTPAAEGLCTACSVEPCAEHEDGIASACRVLEDYDMPEEADALRRKVDRLALTPAAEGQE